MLRGGLFIVFAQWLYLPEALLLRQAAHACCWQLPPVPWPAALCLVACQLDATIGCPVTRFRSAQQSSLAWRMWTGRNLRLFPQCREAACIAAAYCTQVVRQLVGPLDPALPALAMLDTYGWDVDSAAGAACQASEEAGGACQQRHPAAAAVYERPLTAGPLTPGPAHGHSSFLDLDRGAKGEAGGTYVRAASACRVPCCMVSYWWLGSLLAHCCM